MEEKKMVEVHIELSDEQAEGLYSNYTIVSNSPNEFVFDFLRIMPGMLKAKVKARIVITPEHAKRLAKALNENIKKYEHNFGVIEDKSPMPIGIIGPTAQA